MTQPPIPYQPHGTIRNARTHTRARPSERTQNNQFSLPQQDDFKTRNGTNIYTIKPEPNIKPTHIYNRRNDNHEITHHLQVDTLEGAVAGRGGWWGVGVGKYIVYRPNIRPSFPVVEALKIV